MCCRGNVLVGSISGGDAGYNETAKFVSEAAVLLCNAPLPGQAGNFLSSRADQIIGTFNSRIPPPMNEHCLCVIAQVL